MAYAVGHPAATHASSSHGGAVMPVAPHVAPADANLKGFLSPSCHLVPALSHPWVQLPVDDDCDETADPALAFNKCKGDATFNQCPLWHLTTNRKLCAHGSDVPDMDARWKFTPVAPSAPMVNRGYPTAVLTKDAVLY